MANRNNHEHAEDRKKGSSLKAGEGRENRKERVREPLVD